MVSFVTRWHNSKAGFREIMNFDNRWEIVARRLLFRGTGIITYRKGNLEVVVDHHGGDETGTRSCLVSGMYRNLLPQMNIAGPLTVIDIGANGGGFSIMLADHGFTLKKIVAVEMNARVFARMQLNLVQNIDADHRLFNAAISGTNETIISEFGRGSTGESIAGSLGHSSRGTRRRATVEGITFDDLVARSLGPDEIVDICKIDVEGSEFGIFDAGSCQELKRCRYLIIEIHAVEGRDRQGVVTAIKDLGFAELPRPAGGEEDVWCFRNTSLT